MGNDVVYRIRASYADYRFKQFGGIIGNMSGGEYEDAIRTLNTLQIPPEERSLPRLHTNREVGLQMWTRLGFKAEDLNQLNAIHVAGSMGKGSVSAFCDSILREYGLKTGFISSPHLMEIRERIRINGKPISKAQFTAYFWEIYKKLENTKSEYNGFMPRPYTTFVNIMGLYIFLSEKVDVAVVEVGMGGTHDSTNIIPQPTVCAVTLLEFHHTDVLGSTIEEIAGHKGGIFKSGRPALTLPQSYSGALQTLARRALELKASSLHVVPPLHLYPGDQPVPLGLNGQHQHINASLAVQVCKTWLGIKGYMQSSWKDDGFSEMADHDAIPQAETFVLTEQMYQGLKKCSWIGRNEIIQRNGVTYYLDCAHTIDGMKSCAKWFKAMTSLEESRKILIFNSPRERDPNTYLPPLMSCGFTHAFFCTNTATPNGKKADTTRMGITQDVEQAWCKTNQAAFMELDESRAVKTDMFPYISLAIEWIESNPAVASRPEAEAAPKHTCVLVIGGLFLVGATMEALGVTLD